MQFNGHVVGETRLELQENNSSNLSGSYFASDNGSYFASDNI